MAFAPFGGTATILDAAQTITGGVTSTKHDELQELLDDDHTQYVANAIPRTVTAVHTLNPAAPGAPFTLGANALNQLIVGLNADKLDGKESPVGDIVGTTDAQTLSSKTLTTPTIASFINATHNHLNAAGGGTLDAAAIASGVLPVVRGGTGVTTVTGSGDLVLNTSPTIITPFIASFVNANHNHENAAGGGQLDHGLALTGLLDDDHTQYALLAGRAGGQTLNGGTAAGDDLDLNSTTNATKGNVNVGTDGSTVIVGGALSVLGFFAGAGAVQQTPPPAVVDATGAGPAGAIPSMAVSDPAFTAAFPAASGAIDVIVASILFELNGLRAALAAYSLIV